MQAEKDKPYRLTYWRHHGDGGYVSHPTSVGAHVVRVEQLGREVTHFKQFAAGEDNALADYCKALEWAYTLGKRQRSREIVDALKVLGLDWSGRK